MTLGEGAVVGRYRLDEELGSGGAGVVWSASHQVTGRRVALKLVAAPAHRRTAVRQRIALEARAAAALDHPHVVDVLDVFSFDEATWVIVMELLEGETFRARLTEREVLELDEAAELLLPAIGAVGAAHAAGVVHRDLTAENLFIAKRRDGTEAVKVLDFGIAKLVAGDGSLTETGTVVGTPAYMAPEQRAGDEALDHRVDVWALGVILYEALSGGRPVEGRSLREVTKRLREDGIVPLSVVAPDVPDEIASLVDRMLHRDPADRLADLRPVVTALSAHAEVKVPVFAAPGEGEAISLPETGPAPVRGEMSERPRGTETPPSSRPPWRWLAVALVGVVGVVGVVVAQREAAQGEPARGDETRERPVSPPQPTSTSAASMLVAPPAPPPSATAPASVAPSATESAAPSASSSASASPPKPRPQAPAVRPTHVRSRGRCPPYEPGRCPSAAKCCRMPYDLPQFDRNTGLCHCMRPVCKTGEAPTTHFCMVR